MDKRNGVTLSVALAAGLALFLLLGTALHGGLSGNVAPANFYAIFPHNLLAAIFGVVFLFAIVALRVGVRRFWRDVSPGTANASTPAVTEAAKNALTLKYPDGGHGDGCNESHDAFTLARRRFHHFTFYGLMLCSAATVVATLYRYVFGLEAPYTFFSVPVLLGTAGGIGLIVLPWFSFFFGMDNGAMIAALTEVMPAEVCVAGFSLAFSLAAALFGGFTPAVSTFLIEATHDKAAPGYWLSFAALCGLAATLGLYRLRTGREASTASSA